MRKNSNYLFRISRLFSQTNNSKIKPISNENSTELSFDNFPHSEYLYGIHPVDLALKFNRRDFYRLLIKDDIFHAPETDRNSRVTDIIERARLASVPVLASPRSLMNRLANNRPHQGVILHCSPLPLGIFTRHCLSKLSAHPHDSGILIFIEDMKKVLEFGNLLRTCGFFRVLCVLVPSESCLMLHPVVSKVSSGAMEFIPVFRVSDRGAGTLGMLRKSGCYVIGTRASGGHAGQELAGISRGEIRGRKVVLVLGSGWDGGERDTGEQLRPLCDRLVSLPHSDRYGNQSAGLHISTRAGILIHFIQSMIK